MLLITRGTHEDVSLTDAFTTDDDSSRDGEEIDDERNDTVASPMQKPVFTPAEDVDGTMEAHEKEAIGLVLGYLREREAANVWSALFHGRSEIAWKLENISPTDFRYRCSFEPMDYRPISSLVQRFAGRYEYIVKQDIDNMLKARTIMPACNQWAFPVVIAGKMDGQPLFCIDYKMLKQRINGNKLQISNNEEIVDDTSGSWVYTKLDMFARYWQIRLGVHVRVMTPFT